MAIVTTSEDSVRTLSGNWQSELKNAIRTAGELWDALELPREGLAGGEVASRQFPTFVPRPYLNRMVVGDISDPLLRQVLPLGDEMRPVEGFSTDAVGDLASQAQRGVLQKYQGRALLIVSGSCAVHCRYCFRRHFPYETRPASADQWHQALDSVREDTSLVEVILSGGDPLMLTDTALFRLLEQIEQIPHVRRLRIHTRLPIVIPQRMTAGLVERLKRSRLPVYIVIHANHAQEIDEQVASAIARSVDNGIVVLNQSVLLRGVNDTVDSLVALSERLLETRALPYYLHQLDRVSGAAHFEVNSDTGRHLVEQMRHRLPGYGVPRYVREMAGRPHKDPVE